MEDEKESGISSEEEVNLIDYWRIIWKGKWIITGLFIISVLFTMWASLRMPKIYESTASVLPPGIESLSSSYLRIPGALTRTLPSLKGGPTPTDVIIAMLKSRRMAEDTVKRFNLKEVYKKKFLSDTVKALRRATRIKLSKEGIIFVTVESTDPKLAANIANFYVKDLDKMNEELKITTAKPIVKVLDVAKPADRKSKPRIKYNMMISGVVSLFIGIFIVFFMEYINTQRKTLKKMKK